MSNKLIKNNQQNSNDIVIDDGSRVYNIKNKRGEALGQFTFVPSDIGLVGRYEHAVKAFEELQTQLESGEGSDKDKIIEAEKKMMIEIDRLFNANVSETFFKITGPFSILGNGDFFAVHIIETIRTVIEKETGVRLGKAKTRASKYTQKYHK
ncbi:hypothetical protein SAMN05443270_1066 [Lacrimispora sphenoides]|uniref:hypothetical protein n=1 Tax=Lacrimispora sphenoides TaxID=29370 RepID=UPI0008B2BC05|nr:hypothetical protein [Lacrimispora sphenoides]SET71036.1 hypothetical protein SAMN05443270_1066 [Lacrimispora sphenoides]